MNKPKFLNVSIAATSMLLFSGMTTSVSAKTGLSIVKVSKPVCPVYGISNFQTLYSGKTHQIMFKGVASGFNTLTVKYGNKTVKAIKAKKSGQKFKVTIPFKGYGTFKIYDGHGHMLKDISAAQYATKKPRINSYYQTNEYLKIELSGKKGDIVTIWKNGKAVKRKRIMDKFGTTITVPNTMFEDNSKITVTRHTIGKKTSKGVEINKSKDNSISIDK